MENNLFRNPTFRILDIVRGTTVDGPGFRTAIYFAGCAHQCPGCHNPQSWDFHGGEEMTLSELMEIIVEEDFDVTLTGGDPMYHAAEMATLAKSIVESGHTVWLYTGFTIEEILQSKELSKPLPYLEAIVEGPYVESLRDTDLLFRGSSNQRIIKKPETWLKIC